MVKSKRITYYVHVRNIVVHTYIHLCNVHTYMNYIPKFFLSLLYLWTNAHTTAIAATPPKIPPTTPPITPPIIAPLELEEPEKLRENQNNY